jgi:hypothetical protein
MNIGKLSVGLQDASHYSPLIFLNIGVDLQDIFVKI